MSDAVMVTSSFLPGRGGIESYLAELCDRLSPRLAVLAPGRRDGKPLPQDLGYPAIPGPGRVLVPGGRARDAILRAAAEQNTERVLFGTPWPLALLGPSLARRGLRYAVIVHGAELFIPGAVPGLRGRLAGALAGADLLLPVSNYTAGKLKRILEGAGDPVPAMAVLRARVDIERFRPRPEGESVRTRLGLKPDAPIVLTLGRLIRRKGVHRLIAALPDISRRVPNVVLVVAGSGPQESALRRRAALTESRVVFAGPVSDEDAAFLYAAADVFALAVADRWRELEVEGLGVVLLEAAASRVPCVTGRSGGTPEAVIDGVTGRVIDATDRGALVNAIAGLLEHPDEAAAMGRAGRAHVEREFSGPLPQALIDWLG
jgi:phosphatidylinositol alpha-1,6-mannosyltransferase